MERFSSQKYLHTPIPSDGFWLVYETLDRKINKASAFSPPCSHTTSSRPGQAPWQQRFLPGRAPAPTPQWLPHGPGAQPEPPALPPQPPHPLPPARGSGASAGPSSMQSPFSKASRGKLGALEVVVSVFVIVVVVVIFKTLTFCGISQILPVKT